MRAQTETAEAHLARTNQITSETHPKTTYGALGIMAEHTESHPGHAPERQAVATVANAERSARILANNSLVVENQLKRIREALESPAKRLRRSDLEQLSQKQLGKIPRVMKLEAVNEALKQQVEELKEEVKGFEVGMEGLYEDFECLKEGAQKMKEQLEVIRGVVGVATEE